MAARTGAVLWKWLIIILFNCIRFVQRLAFVLQNGFLWLLERYVRWIALNLSPIILLLLLLALGLLFWNYRAPQAPAWITASMSIVCGGVISLLAIGKPIRKKRYIVGTAVLFMLLPAALGCWAALQPDSLPEEMVSFVTILEEPQIKARLEADPNWQKEYPYMRMMRTLIEEELRRSPEAKNGQRTQDEQFNQKVEMASSMSLMEIILFQQMRWRFERDWDVKVDTSNVFGMKQVSIGPNSRVPGRKKHVWKKSDLQKALPENMFLNQLPDSYQVVLPQGMTITTEPIDGWPNHALVFEDAYCRIRFQPEGRSLTRAFWLSDDQERQPFINHLRVGIQVTFKGFRVGTRGTMRRKEWVKALFGQLKEPTQWILVD